MYVQRVTKKTLATSACASSCTCRARPMLSVRVRRTVGKKNTPRFLGYCFFFQDTVAGLLQRRIGCETTRVAPCRLLAGTESETKPLLPPLQSEVEAALAAAAPTAIRRRASVDNGTRVSSVHLPVLQESGRQPAGGKWGVESGTRTGINNNGGTTLDRKRTASHSVSVDGAFRQLRQSDPGQALGGAKLKIATSSGSLLPSTREGVSSAMIAVVASAEMEDSTRANMRSEPRCILQLDRGGGGALRHSTCMCLVTRECATGHMMEQHLFAIAL